VKIHYIVALLLVPLVAQIRDAKADVAPGQSQRIVHVDMLERPVSWLSITEFQSHTPQRWRRTMWT